jgi:opacity protein-like surface antigen
MYYKYSFGRRHMVRKIVLGLLMTVFVFASTPAFAESGKFSVGVIGGGAWSTADNAIWGRSGTNFESAAVYGGRLMYWFPQQIGLELAVDRIALDVKDSGRDVGTLSLTPVMLVVKAQGMPRGGTGFTGHLEIGGGLNFTDFDENPSGDELGFPYTIETETAFVYAIGAGADYFLSEHFSLSLDGRWMGGEVDSVRKTEEVTGTRKDDLTFFIYNLELLMGVRYWF